MTDPAIAETRETLDDLALIGRDRDETPEEKATRRARHSACYNRARKALLEAQELADSSKDWARIAEGWRDLGYMA